MKDDYDFYKCDKCGRLITLVEEKRACSTGKICPCGSPRYRPANMSWWHWFLPRVWIFALLRIRGVV